jgi:hypothetical protein
MSPRLPSAIGRIFPNGSKSVFFGVGITTYILDPTSLDISAEGPSVFVITHYGDIGTTEYSGTVYKIRL